MLAVAPVFASVGLRQSRPQRGIVRTAEDSRLKPHRRPSRHSGSALPPPPTSKDSYETSEPPSTCSAFRSDLPSHPISTLLDHPDPLETACRFPTTRPLSSSSLRAGGREATGGSCTWIQGGGEEHRSPVRSEGSASQLPLNSPLILPSNPPQIEGRSAGNFGGKFTGKFGQLCP